MITDISDEFYEMHNEKYEEFIDSMTEKEKEIYKKIKEENLVLGRLNMYDYLKYDVKKIASYSEIIISGKYDLCPGDNDMNIIKAYRKADEWFIQVSYVDKPSIVIPITDNKFVMQTFDELIDHEFIETDEYFYRIMAKELSKSGKKF